MPTNTRAVPLRIPAQLLELAEAQGKDQRTDRSTVLRQWLYKGAEEIVLKWLSDARISIGRAAELLDVSVYDVYALAEARGVELGGGEEEYQASRESATNLLRRK